MPTQRKRARLIKTGDVVRLKGSEQTEPVRSVSVVLHLANGWDEVYTDDEEVVWIGDDPPITVEELEELDARAVELQMENDRREKERQDLEAAIEAEERRREKLDRETPPEAEPVPAEET